MTSSPCWWALSGCGAHSCGAHKYDAGEVLMPNRVLCPKCHGQRTISCSACQGSGETSFGGITIGTCRECDGTGQHRCNVCGGSGEVEAESAIPAKSGTR